VARFRRAGYRRHGSLVAGAGALAALTTAGVVASPLLAADECQPLTPPTQGGLTYAVVPASAVQKVEGAAARVANITATGVVAVARQTPAALRLTARGAQAVGGFGLNVTRKAGGGISWVWGAGVNKFRSQRAKL